MGEGAEVISRSRKTFSIAFLLVITTIIALHVAFPVLFEIWWIGAVFAILLLLVMLPVMVLVALTSPPSPKGQLDVGKNKPLKYLFGLYVLLVGGFFLMALTTDLIKQSHFF